MKIGQRILIEFKNGKKPIDLISLGHNKNTVYKYWKSFKEYQELSQIVNEKLWNLIYESA